MTLRRRLARRLPAPVRVGLGRLRKGELLSPHSRVAYSQEGEDLLLLRMLEGKGAGFYVDIGAHHPERFSNTRLLHDRGWRGINIDGTPGSMAAFRRQRPDDINIEAVISSDGEPREFFQFDEPALNSVSKSLSSERVSMTDYRIMASTTLPTRKLADVLDEFLPRQVPIDLMSVDVEGHDLDVLQSNDWARYRPGLLLVEVLNTSLAALADSDVIRLLAEHDYEATSKLVNTVVLTDRLRSAGTD